MRSLVAAALDRVGTSPRVLLREVAAFGVVGGLAFLLDVAVFQLLYSNSLGAVTAKAISTLLSMAVAYLGNRYWSFSHRSTTSVRRELLLFLLVNGFTGLLNLGIVALARYGLHQDSAVVLQAANVFGIGLGTVIRYASYRTWVFPAEAAQPAPVLHEPTVPAGRRQASEAA